MARFEIIYSGTPTSKALCSQSVVARNRAEAASIAVTGLPKAQLAHGARYFRIVDALGMVVTRGPKGAATHEVDETP
jgi:hypothetical protein